MKHAMGMMTGLLLAACGEKGGSPQQQATMTPDVAGATGQQAPVVAPSKTMGASSFGVIPQAACTGTPGEPVTWKLGNVFKQLSDDREVKPEMKQGNKTDLALASNKVGPNWPTSLDMDVSTSVGTPPGPANDYVMVTIELSTGRGTGNPGIYFMRPPSAVPQANPPFVKPDPNQPKPNPDPTASTVAVMAPVDRVDRFCGRTDIDIQNGKEVMSFGIKKGGETLSINVGLLVPSKPKAGKTPYWLPIFLDPNMRNEG